MKSIESKSIPQRRLLQMLSTLKDEAKSRYKAEIHGIYCILLIKN